MTCLFAAATPAMALLTSSHTTARRQLVASAATPRVPAIADVTLRDVAVAVYQPDRSIIYYNPRRLESFSPAMQTFFLTHERAHIVMKHTRAAALGSEGAAQG